jgi:ABC-type ATPase involved in cell division
MSEVHEKIGALTAKADAAHSRLDKVETQVRDDLKSIKEELHELNAHMNKGKGWASAMIFLAGLSGAGATKLISVLFNHN